MSEPAIRLTSVGKMYKVFPTRADNFLDALGASRFMPWRKKQYREFWALRGVDLELQPGQRVGVIGRNGAGKSTMLKLITGNVATTEGIVEVNGQVQALLDAGAGLHPEFTGRENVHAALTYQGLSRRAIRNAEEDIADFTELGDYLDQPFRTYSVGMQARLGFAISTVVRPEILIVDEVLGAGDAYFFTKSTGRMHELVESGCTVLIVSHSLDHVVRFCERSIWLDRGRIVMAGSTVDVVKAYEKFIRLLENKRLKAKNQEQHMPQRPDGFERSGLSDQILVRIAPGGGRESRCDVASVNLLKDGEVEDSVDVGGVQDSDETSPARILLREGRWATPISEGEETFRRIEGDPATLAAFGLVVFGLWFFYPESDYEVEIRYRSAGAASMIGVGRGSHVDAFVMLPPASGWRTERVPLHVIDQLDEDEEETTDQARADLSRWPGRRGLLIESVQLLDEQGEEQAIFITGALLTVKVEIRAEEAGTYPLILAALVFRDDGIVATRHVAPQQTLTLTEGEGLLALLEFGPLLLGDGGYLLSIGLYSSLDVNDIEPSEIYDYFDRSFEFRVVGNPRLHNEFLRHPGHWQIESVRSGRRQPDEAARP